MLLGTMMLVAMALYCISQQDVLHIACIDVQFTRWKALHCSKYLGGAAVL